MSQPSYPAPRAAPWHRAPVLREPLIRWRLFRRAHPLRLWHGVAAGLALAALWICLGLVGGVRGDLGLRRQFDALVRLNAQLAQTVAERHAELAASTQPGWQGAEAATAGLASPQAVVYVLQGPGQRSARHSGVPRG